MRTVFEGRISPLVFVVAGSLLVGLLGFGVDVLLASGSVPDIDGPLAGVTEYNFTVSGVVVGAALGGFVGFGLV